MFAYEGYGSYLPRKKMKCAQGDISPAALSPAPQPPQNFLYEDGDQSDEERAEEFNKHGVSFHGPWLFYIFEENRLLGLLGAGRAPWLPCQMLELTTRFQAITTAPAAGKKARSVGGAIAAACAHLRYIDRSSAVGERAVSGISSTNQAEIRAKIREAIRHRARKGGATGSRILEKGIISLPNTWPAFARERACEAIAEFLAPAGSEAMALVVTHRDKSQNSHLHFAAVDGFESQSAARARRPNAKRVRRAQVIRLGNRGRPKEMRREIAAILNGIASENGLEQVEWRSFEDRGLIAIPTRHEGPTRRAETRRGGQGDPRAAENEKRLYGRSLSLYGVDFVPIDELFPEMDDFPRIIRRGDRKRKPQGRTRVRVR
ncbi:MobA/MobL family protein [Yangia sp. PrR004]|nr:MobA/MobL family protein [Salipiger sp. PrR004]